MNENTVKRKRGGQLGYVTHKTAQKLALKLVTETMRDQNVHIDTRVRAASIVLSVNKTEVAKNA